MAAWWAALGRGYISVAIALSLAALVLAFPAITLGQPATASCARNAMASRFPPAIIPRALVTRYPNGAEITAAVTVSPNGKFSATKYSGSDNMGAALALWAKSSQFVPALKACKPVASTIYVDIDFYPPASGVIGLPTVADGVNFGNLRYTDGPGNCKTAPMRNGSYDDPEAEYTAEVNDVFAGSVAGQPVAVVILRCEYNGHGFDSQAQLFAVTGGTAHRLGILGAGGMMSSDSVLPAWPGGWIHVSFSADKLYADVWDHDRQCDRNGDWISSAYTIRNGRLALLNRLRHHRQGVALTCER